MVDVRAVEPLIYCKTKGQQKRIVDMKDELELMPEPYDWDEAFRQNPDQADFDWPEEADEAAARVLADQVEGWLAEG